MNALLRTTPAPIGLLAELTHRCPLRCPYCSNPLELERRSASLTPKPGSACSARLPRSGFCTFTSPAANQRRGPISSNSRPIARARASIRTSSRPGSEPRRQLDALAEAGLDHVQLSLQAAEARRADRIAGLPGAHDRKRAFAARVAMLGLPLTVNTVDPPGQHRGCRALLLISRSSWGRGGLEIAHAQYYGWAWSTGRR